jgi:hypothetical protein
MIVGTKFDGFGDTTLSSAVDLIKGQYAPGIGECSIRKFVNMRIALDRGYARWALKMELAIKMQIEIEVAMDMRTKDNPITFDQEIKDGDKRILVSKTSKKSALRLEYQPPGGAQTSEWWKGKL